jgi:hypothetical protein
MFGVASPIILVPFWASFGIVFSMSEISENTDPFVELDE